MCYEQHDAHEFATMLIDYIHEELVKVTKKDINHVGTLPTDDFWVAVFFLFKFEEQKI